MIVAPRIPLHLIIIGLACFAAGCTAAVSGRTDRAVEAAAVSQMQKVEFAAAPFILTGWQKITRPGEPVHLYIEGDGFAWMTRNRPSANPTPKTPTGLYLAGADNGANVIYLARPCQYTPLEAPGNQGCSDSDYWLSKRFSAEVVASYMSVLDTIAQQTGAKEFIITGYSGGANIAGLLAARRSDITRFRSVAGNLDNDYFTRLHDVSAMPYSLNVADHAAQLATLPQIHFIGAEDETVPAEIYQSYALKAGASPCLKQQIVRGASHSEGWREAWPSLLNTSFSCP